MAAAPGAMRAPGWATAFVAICLLASGAEGFLGAPPSPVGRARRFGVSAATCSVLGGAGSRVQVATTAAAFTAKEGIQLAVSTFMGYGILVGSLFLQLPQIVKIITSKSTIGISRTSRYFEVPINSSAVIYHYLKKLPFSTYGENVAVLVQNLVIVSLVWIWQEPKIKRWEMLAVAAGFVALCTAQLMLPPALYPLLIYINLPLVFSSCIPQIHANWRQKHTGQLAILSYFLKLVGNTVRIFTTVTQIGLDAGLLCNYGFGALMNLTIVIQGLMYSKETERVRLEEKAKKDQRAKDSLVVDEVIGWSKVE